MNDPAFAVRESAEMHLLTDDTLDEATLKALIQQARSPEQRHRLLRVAEHHMMRLMRERDFSGVNEEEDALPQAAVRRSAAVGYSYEPVLADANPHAELPGVRVIATMPGFPGHAYLRRGDIIVQIAGQGPSAQQREEGITAWMRWRISQHEAGDRIEFTVLRDGELLKLSMLAAEGQALDHMYTTDAFEAAARKQPYQSAWQAVRDEMIALMPRPTRLTPRGIEPANERD